MTNRIKNESKLLVLVGMFSFSCGTFGDKSSFYIKKNHSIFIKNKNHHSASIKRNYPASTKKNHSAPGRINHFDRFSMIYADTQRSGVIESLLFKTKRKSSQEELVELVLCYLAPIVLSFFNTAYYKKHPIAADFIALLGAGIIIVSACITYYACLNIYRSYIKPPLLKFWGESSIFLQEVNTIVTLQGISCKKDCKKCEKFKELPLFNFKEKWTYDDLEHKYSCIQEKDKESLDDLMKKYFKEEKKEEEKKKIKEAFKYMQELSKQYICKSDIKCNHGQCKKFNEMTFDEFFKTNDDEMNKILSHIGQKLQFSDIENYSIASCQILLNFLRYKLNT